MPIRQLGPGYSSRRIQLLPTGKEMEEEKNEREREKKKREKKKKKKKEKEKKTIFFFNNNNNKTDLPRALRSTPVSK